MNIKVFLKTNKNESDRIERLLRVKSVLNLFHGVKFITKIEWIDDDKGCLNVEWENRPSREETEFIKLVWALEYEYHVYNYWGKYSPVND